MDVHAKEPTEVGHSRLAELDALRPSDADSPSEGANRIDQAHKQNNMLAKSAGGAELRMSFCPGSLATCPIGR